MIDKSLRASSTVLSYGGRGEMIMVSTIASMINLYSWLEKAVMID